jgi:hypothetical protein
MSPSARVPRPLADKLTDISLRNPKWMLALGVLADMELKRLAQAEQDEIKSVIQAAKHGDHIERERR